MSKPKNNIGDFRFTCLYRINNLITGDCYVGSAWDFWVRRRRHFSSLRRGKHKNPKLQNAFNKYGEENFRMVPIIRFDKTQINRETLYREEERYINLLSPKYNINLKTGTKFDVPKESRDRGILKISKKWTLINPSGEEMTIINLAKFCRENNLSRSAMGNVASGVAKTHKGWSMKHPDGFIPKRNIDNPNRRPMELSGKEFILTTPDDKNIEILNLQKFCRENNLNHVGMLHTAMGRQSNHRGWKCRYKNKKQ